MATQEQLNVINDLEGSIFLSAAAGSGKTTVIKERFINMIKHGIEPSRILCITFTNKAGKEMRDRISKATGMDPSKLSIFTFHGLCNYWLRKHSSMLGIHNYSIMEEDLVTSTLKQISSSEIFSERRFTSFASVRKSDNKEDVLAEFLEVENKDFKTKKYTVVRKALSILAKSNSPLKHSIEISRLCDNPKFIETCVEKFQQFKKEHNLLDFNDLHSYGTELFEKHIDLSKHYDKIMIDEAQDLSVSDLRLVKALKCNEIMAVGDKFQSIYLFRGADSDNIKSFISHFNAKTYNLTMNFRSDSSIIAVANSVIKDPEYVPMVAFSKEKGKTCLVELLDDTETNQFILNHIKKYCNVK